VDRALAGRLAGIVLDNLATRWPYQLIALVRDPDEALAPQARTPMFDTCFDWHSSVHNHWALVRLLPWLDGAQAEAAERALDASLTAERAAAEVRHLEGHPSFERPYGLAWLVTLGAAARRPALGALVAIARDRLVAWARALRAPIRAGEHSQSMFAMALALDAARDTGDAEAEAAHAEAAWRLHGGDRDAPLHFEPSAYDFLSPALATAWLVARVIPAGDFARWLDGFASRLGRGQALAPVGAVDRVDGKLAHWDGLALSRAWMLDDLADALPPGDERIAPLAASAREHLAVGTAAIDASTYAGRHWLPSFAVYALVASKDRRSRADRGGAPA
jgi:hypothetical protein